MGEHPALKNLFGQVVAGSFGWERWGLLSVLSDCVLKYVQGNILEIGCGESSIYLSKLAEKYNRNCFHVEYSKSGVYNMKNTKGYFGEKSIVYNCTSDKFFQDASTNMKFALAFIDGDHKYETVVRDFYNTVIHLVEGGFIFLHDTYPPDITWISEAKCGTVNVLRKEIEDDPEYEIFTFPFTAFNVGLSMVRVRPEREWETFKW